MPALDEAGKQKMVASNRVYEICLEKEENNYRPVNGQTFSVG